MSTRQRRHHVQCSVFLLLSLFVPYADARRCVQLDDGTNACESMQTPPPAHFDYGTGVDMNISRPYQRHTPLTTATTENTTLRQTSVISSDSSTFRAFIKGSTTPARIRAINRCMEIVSGEWVSKMPVDVLVRFEFFESEFLLGMAQPTANWNIRSFVNPIALAEAILGRNLNPTGLSEENERQYDVLMTLNSNAPWYDGVDARPTGGTYDLVTVCLHEVYHGLFMSGGNLGLSRDGVSYSGYVVNDDVKGRFEAFMANQDGCNIDGYVQTPLHLGTALSGNNLWFVSGTEKVARLHAPTPYISGSSWYHLSEVEYGSRNDNNDLMTPVIGSSYAQHNPGDIVRKMQAAAMAVYTNSGAQNCEILNDPVVSNISVGGGGAVGDGGPDRRNESNGFIVRLGDTEISGWVFVGAGIAGIVLIAGIIVLVKLVAGKVAGPPSGAAARPSRRVGVEDQVRFAQEGNGGGIV